MKKVKNKICKSKGCEVEFTPFVSFQKYCSWGCAQDNAKVPEKRNFKPIPKKSAKRKKEDIEYLKKRAVFLNKEENKKCPVFPNLYTTDVHHKKGRIGFADEQARLEGISLYLDERFWLAVSRKGHKKIEENPAWAKENGYSIDRLAK